MIIKKLEPDSGHIKSTIFLLICTAASISVTGHSPSGSFGDFKRY